MNSKTTLFLVAPLAIWALWTLFSPSDSDNKKPEKRMWNATVNEQGQLSVLGVTIDQTTLKEATKILNSHSEQALFISPKNSDKKPVIEAFFPKMPDGSKMILNLAASDELIEKIINSAYSPMAFPSGNIKFKIAEEHMQAIETLKVSSMTAIPRIKITQKMLINQFGSPEQQVLDGDIMHNLYPQIGLDAILDQSGEVMLQFVAPDSFQKILTSLGVTPDLGTSTE
ncbi:MAG: hypothetical protein L3J70_10635 [Gammaproteobacteria bacterium]|nr:hypothetical protein [Gammaproteobacteria bacterium]